MGWQTTIDDPHGVVEIRFSEAIRPEEHLKARDELLQICRDRNIHKILADARELEIRDETSTMTLFDFGASWAELTRDMPILLAGVLPRDTHTQKELMFGDTVAFNRGFVTRAFDNIEDARLWLWITDR